MPAEYGRMRDERRSDRFAQRRLPRVPRVIVTGAGNIILDGGWCDIEVEAAKIPPNINLIRPKDFTTHDLCLVIENRHAQISCAWLLPLPASARLMRVDFDVFAHTARLRDRLARRAHVVQVKLDCLADELSGF